ncbi:TetR/AcrR family transcriptional regulator [Streptomyces sp. AK02-01A]|uniref:TetR/AcrR family transcriptional regulator n=1 Tax=Streptomyces sp. AK02-01A TaxID=3028648 RepID=UPI0029ABDF13|nr:TetR/AcrR family transcriptional regulator [Streptomyces sp. AK02-01A]MDX3855552.1 TetR/AcrR family transcriptional regulator [Streptomyces sp. AK02-01A]
MGHREDLLEGAKRCLLEKGYARTTARDIVAASGTNLASIGYHYGSKEALLNKAFVAVAEEWSDSVGPRRSAAEPSDDPLERLAAVWEEVIGAFEQSKALWKLQFEIVSRLEREPELQKALAGPQLAARHGLAKSFRAIDPEKDPEKARLVGTVCQAMLTGVMAQWLIDPETAPGAQDLTDGLRAIMAGDD